MAIAIRAPAPDIGDRLTFTMLIDGVLVAAIVVGLRGVDHVEATVIDGSIAFGIQVRVRRGCTSL